MKAAVSWTIYIGLVVSAALSFAVSTYFVADFYKLRHSKAIAARMPEIIVFQLAITAIPLLFDAVSIPLYEMGIKHDYKQYQLVKVGYIVAFITAKITRVWSFNWRYAFLRHEMGSMWKSEMQVAASKSWAVRFAPVFSNWALSLLFWFSITALLFFTATSLLFAITHSRVVASIASLVAFGILYIPAFWTLYYNKECRDVYGVRNQLMLEVFLVAAFLLSGASLAPVPKFSLLHRFLSFSMYVVFTGVYFFATTRFQLWKLEPYLSSGQLQTHLRLRSLTRTVSPKPQSGSLFKSLTHILKDYAGFDLLAEHCYHEMAANHLFFVVAYMRLKEYLFRFLKAEDCFQFEAGAPHSEDGAMLQQILGQTTTVPPTDSLQKPVCALLAKMSTTKLPVVSMSATAETEAEDLCHALDLDSQMQSESAPTPATKHKYRHQMGRIVQLPPNVLRLQFAEYSLDGCVQRVAELFAKYLHEGDCSVNIASSTRYMALNSLRSLNLSATQSMDERMQCLWECIGTCDTVLVAVLGVLKANSFSRLTRKPEYQKWLDSAN